MPITATAAVREVERTVVDTVDTVVIELDREQANRLRDLMNYVPVYDSDPTFSELYEALSKVGVPGDYGHCQRIRDYIREHAQ